MPVAEASASVQTHVHPPAKFTGLILEDISRPVTGTALNLGSKTIAIMPSCTVCYKKKYEE
jgi:hypothetical protein